jgi:hypothetical protein
MYGYGQQGPAQWAGQQQRQQHNSIQNLVNMLMQVKMMKHREGIRGQEREEDVAFRDQQLSSLDRHRKLQEEQWDKPTVQKIPDWYTQAKVIADETGESIGAVMKRIKYGEPQKKEPQIPTSPGKNLSKYMVENYGANWRKEMSYDDFKDIRDHRQELIRADKAKKEPTKPTVTPTSKFSKRGSILKDVDDTWVKIQNTKADAFHDSQLMDDYRNRAGVHLDMPRKYTKTIRLMEMDLATPAEQQYYIDASETKAVLDGFPEIMSITELAPALRAELNIAIAKEILALRKKKRNKILGIL